MESQQRQVIVKTWNTEQRKYVDIATGVFCGWGVDYEEFPAGPGNHTACIVEFKDGTVGLFHPSLIQFTVPEEK